MRYFPVGVILIIVIFGVAWRFAFRSVARRYNISGVWYFLAFAAFAVLALLLRMAVLRHMR